MEVPFYLRTIRLLQRYLRSVVTGNELKETLKKYFRTALLHKPISKGLFHNIIFK